MLDPLMAEIAELARSRTADQPIVRRHLKHGPLCAYVRINTRVCAGRAFDALVLADVEIAQEARGAGLYRALVARLEAELPALGLQAIVHENVTNQRLHSFLLRQGCQPCYPGQLCLFPTLFKELTPCPSTSKPATKTTP